MLTLLLNFQPMCETLGWELSDTFVDRFLIVLLVVCADPDLIDSTTQDLSSSWNSDQIRVKAAFASAIKKAVQKKTIRYKSGFKFFKTLLPSLGFYQIFTNLCASLFLLKTLLFEQIICPLILNPDFCQPRYCGK